MTLSRKTALARASEPMKRTPIKKRNPKRKARLFLEDFGGKAYRDHIAAMPCVWCLRHGRSDPHHVRSRGAGGKAADMVPLCRECHDAIHRTGTKAQRAYLAERAADLRQSWLAEQTPAAPPTEND